MITCLNWGCGSIQPAGWCNSDRDDHGQEHVGDILDGLPWPDGHFDLIVANHSLQELGCDEIVPALTELRRVTRPGGLFRALVPDPIAAVDAYQRGDRAWFPIGPDLPGIDDAFCCYLNWFGSTRSIFTRRRIDRLLADVGWRHITQLAVGETMFGQRLDAAALDDRAAEQPIVVEARR